MRNFRKYLLSLPLVLLIYGLSIYLPVPAILNAQETDDGAVLPNNAGPALVDPEAERPANSLEDYRSIRERNVFQSGRGEAPAKEATVIEIPSRNANFGFRLVGTAVMENSRESLAILYRDDTGRQQACQEGSRLGQVLIKKILRDRVIIDAGRGEKILSMYHGGGIENVGISPGLARLDQKEVATVLPEYMSLVKTIRIRPYFEAGKPGGIRVSNIDPRGLFGKMGLQDGDVITGVNGKRLTVTLDAVEIYNHLKQGGRITLTVLRGEEKVQLRLDVS